MYKTMLVMLLVVCSTISTSQEMQQQKQGRLIALIGPPGSGKGTLSQYCVQELGWKHLSTGNLLRKHVLEQTEIGKRMEFILKSGKLVSDGIINSMVEQWLLNAFQGTTNAVVILDGYPRIVEQAGALDLFLREKLPDVKLDIVYFNISDQIAIDRMSARYVCQNKECQTTYSLLKGSSLSTNMRPSEDMTCKFCGHKVDRRIDDVLDIVRDRLQTYCKHEQDLVVFYKQQGRDLIECNAEQPPNDLFKDFKMLMNIN